MKPFDHTIIGGGIVGLSTAVHLAQRFPKASILLVEKEEGPARHQSGRNSGVIHSGIYYRPGSLKARLATEGARTMAEFCEMHGIPHRICGKLITAASDGEIPELEKLHRRGIENGVPVERIDPGQVREIEPHVSCKAALAVKSTGITDYRLVSAKLRELFETAGGTTRFGTEVLGVVPDGNRWILETTKGAVESAFLINCAGLHSDRIAAMAGCVPDARIIPFRGEYYQLIPEREHLVRGLVYPVPDPAFPFLGVHLTRMVDGSVHAGPNAVPAFAREGYRKRDVVLRDLFSTLSYPGFLRLAAANPAGGLREIRRSFSKQAFVESLRRLVPEIGPDDLVPCAAGVRAQALRRDGSLVDDFLIQRGRNALHVCNAPSPAATACLPIGREIAAMVT
jgi:L-2-hydroxyglutarate oxidase